VYTAAPLRQDRNAKGALAFVEFLLADAGRQVAARHGLLAAPVLYGGDRAAIPASIESQLQGEYRG
jgi:ABC-type Fe3+ transport system substrate-binding protein